MNERSQSRSSSKGKRDYKSNDKPRGQRGGKRGWQEGKGSGGRGHGDRRKNEGYSKKRYDDDSRRHRQHRHEDGDARRTYSERKGEDRDHRGPRGKGGPRQQRQHSARGGQDRQQNRYQPRRKNFREERTQKHLNEPPIPAEVSAKDLDPLILQDLRVLSKDNADRVARHMVAAAMFMDEDPELALRHARAAKERGGRVAVTRETCGIAAYRAGEWKEALSELRAARRMSGGPGLVAVMADCERGLGRPAKAIEMAESPEAAVLDPDSALELAIVVAGARQDMGDYQAAVTILEHQDPGAQRSAFEASRVAYAYASALELVERLEDAKAWFAKAVELDEDGLTDAELRLKTVDNKLKEGEE